MADDKDKTGKSDRDRVASGEGYEVSYFAQKHGMPEAEARALIARVGNDREKLDAAAARATDSKGAPAKSAPRTQRTAAVKSPNSEVATRGRARPNRRTAAGGTATVSSVAKARVAALPKTARKAVEKGTRQAATVAGGKAAAMVGAAAVGLMTGLAVSLGRKALVQAPSAMSGDWLEAVKTEHAMALALFDQLQKTTNDEGAKRSTLLMQLKHALGKHAFMEENVLYPALRDWGDKADADKLNHDHGYVKQFLYDLENLDAAASAFLVMVDAFRRQIEDHIREEESSIFPPLHAALSADANAKLTAQANKEAFKLA